MVTMSMVQSAAHLRVSIRLVPVAVGTQVQVRRISKRFQMLSTTSAQPQDRAKRCLSDVHLFRAYSRESVRG